MTWPLSILLCFTVFVLSILGFLLIIYFKEFSREDVIIKQYAKKKTEQTPLVPMYVLLSDPNDPNSSLQKIDTKNAPPTPPSKDKKGLN